MKLHLKSYTLILKNSFRIARSVKNTQDNLIVKLTYKGKTGYGETTPNTYYNNSIESLNTEIETLRTEIENFDFTTPQYFYAMLSKSTISNFAKCALDIAAHDLYGKLQNKPLYKLWGLTIDHYPTSNYTIGLDTIDNMIAKMKAKPWPIYKIKLGTKDDIAIVTALRKHTNAIFRVDANCAWTVKETIKNAIALKKLNVEFIEQPLKAIDLDGAKEVLQKSVLPIIADESCIIPSDVQKCKNHFHGINIKLVKCGGITPALQMIKEAKELGLKVMVGCMTESTVGISAVAQLLPLLDYVDMDGAMLLKKDIATGVRLLPDGTVVFSELSGTGVGLLDEVYS